MERIEQFNTSIKSPARVFTWDVDFPAVDGGPEVEIPKIRAQSTTLPGISITEIELHNWGLPIKYAGQIKYDNRWDITIAEDEDYQVYNYLQAWRAMIVSMESTHVLDKPNYARPLILTLRDVENYGSTLKVFTFSQAWPSNIASVALDKSNASTSVKFGVTFTYDYYLVA